MLDQIIDVDHLADDLVQHLTGLFDLADPGLDLCIRRTDQLADFPCSLG